MDLKYLDEAGFCLWSPASYSYSPIGEQKRLEQTPQRDGNRISILGLWQPTQGFEYALAQGGFKDKSYIEMMDWVAQKAAQSLAETGRITVVLLAKLFHGYWRAKQQIKLLQFTSTRPRNESWRSPSMQSPRSHTGCSSAQISPVTAPD